jgi:hypothetical protein
MFEHGQCRRSWQTAVFVLFHNVHHLDADSGEMDVEACAE